MRKILILIAIFTAICGTTANAQTGTAGDPAAMREQYIQKIKPQLVDKAKITETEADKVLEINFRYRSKLRGLRDLNEEDRKKMMDQIQAAQTKEYTAIPLTEVQIKAVNDFFEEQQKLRQQNNGGKANANANGGSNK